MSYPELMARGEEVGPSAIRVVGAIITSLLMLQTVTVGTATNGPPPIEAVAGSDVTVDVGEAVTFDASDSTGAAPLQYLWFFGSGDAELGGLPALSQDKTATFAYPEEGVHEAILIVVDGMGRHAVDTKVVTVRNVLPRAEITVGPPGPDAVDVNEDQLVVFSGAGSQDTDGLSYRWDFGDGTEGFGAEAEHAYGANGTYVARLEVRDPKGAENRTAVIVRVANVPPEAAASFPTEAAEDQPILFDAGASSDTPSDLAGLVYRWDLGDGAVEIGPQIHHSYGASGTYDVRLTVIDDNGGSSQVEGVIQVVNQPPKAVLPENVVADVTATVFFDASSSEDTPSDLPGLNYTWDFDIDGLVDAYGRLATHVFRELGDHLVQLEVRDDDGARDSAFALVQVVCPLIEEEDEDDEDEDEEECEAQEELPEEEDEGDEDEEVEILAALEDEAVTFVAEEEDEEDEHDVDHEEEDIFRWIFRDGTQAVGRVVQHAFAQAGTYHVLLLEIDSRDGEVEDFEFFTVNVRNVAPLAAISASGTGEEDALHSFDGGETLDTPSDRPSLRYRWDFGDGAVGVGPVVNHAYAQAGDYVVTLRVQDDNGAFSVASEAVSIDNVPPMASFEAPPSAFVEEPVLFVGTSVDTPSDEGVLGLSWTLSDGGTGVGREFTHTSFQPGTLSVALSVVDDEGATDLAAGTLHAENGPPVAHLPFDSFSVYGKDITASFRGLGFDALNDQESLAFAWDFGDGRFVAGPATVEHAYDRSGTYSLTLTVTDPHGATDADTAVVNVILDADLDGLPDLYEIDVAGTDPASADTDEDGLLDPFEVLGLEIDVLVQDSDFDGWTDFEEINAVHGYVTNATNPDTDGDGLPDGSEVYTQAFRTTERFQIRAGGSLEIPLFNVASGAPPFAIEAADARLGIVHPRVGDLSLSLVRETKSADVEIESPEAPNLFVSVDLLQVGFTPEEMRTEAAWRLLIGNGGGRGTLEYFEIHLTARTSPLAADTDGDLLNDTEEGNPGEDGWITDPWRTDTDRDGLSDFLEVQGWRETGSGAVEDPLGFRTDPTRRDTDRDGVGDRSDTDPIHDLMVRLTLGNWISLDGDPDLDDSFPEPFVEVVVRGESFFTPHVNPGPDSTFLNLDRVYTVDVPDFVIAVSFTLRAWDDDLILGNDKQWDLDGKSPRLDTFVFFQLLDETTGEKTASGLGSDGDEGSCGTLFPDPNACRDALLQYRVDTVRAERIPTILVESLDTNDLLETASGDLRYLGDDVFYIAWVNVTSPSEPFQVGLNAVLVPRAQFFNSSLNDTLQTSNSANLPAHLKGLEFTAFDEEAGVTTGAIAGVLSGTLSGSAASLLLQQLTEGPDGEGNGDWTVVTDQIVTLGLPDRVVNAIPIAGIRFDEATAEGPGSFLGDFLNLFLTAATFVAEGLVLIGSAIAAFFEQAVDFLVELGMAVIGAIGVFLMQVAEAVENVGEALLNFVAWFVSFVLESITLLMQPIIDVYDDMVENLASVAAAMANGSSHGRPHTPERFALEFSDAIFFSLLSFAVLGLIAGLAVIQAVSTGISFGLAPIVLGAALGLAASLILSVIVADVIAIYGGSTVFEEVIPDWYDDAAAIGFTAADFLLLIGVRARQTGPNPLRVGIVNVGYAFWFAFLALATVSAKTAVPVFVSDQREITVANTLLDSVAIALALLSLAYGIDVIGKGANFIRFHHWLLIPLSIIFTTAAIATSFSGFLTDLNDLAEQTGNPLP